MGNTESRAFESEHGFKVSDGQYITGGSASPVGLDLPTSTFYLQTPTTGGVVVWRKYDTGVNDWIKASPIDFYYYFESVGLSSTTSTTFQDKISQSIYLPVGDFRIGFAFEAFEAGANSIPEFQVILDGVVIWSLADPSDLTKDYSVSSFVKSSIASAGNKTLAIQYRNQTSGRTTNIRNARIEVWRVA